MLLPPVLRERASSPKLHAWQRLLHLLFRLGRWELTALWPLKISCTFPANNSRWWLMLIAFFFECKMSSRSASSYRCSKTQRLYQRSMSKVLPAPRCSCSAASRH